MGCKVETKRELDEAVARLDKEVNLELKRAGTASIAQTKVKTIGYAMYDPTKDATGFDVLSTFGTATESVNVYASVRMDTMGIGLTNLLSGPVGRGNKWLKKEYPRYADTIDSLHGVWNESSLVGQMRHYMNIDPKKIDSEGLNEMTTSELLLQEERTQIDNEMVGDLENKIHHEYGIQRRSKAGDKFDKLVDTTFAQSALFELVEDGELEAIVNGESIESVIDRVGKGISNSDGELARGLADGYIGKPSKVTTAVNANVVHNRTSPEYKQVTKLSALLALQSTEGSVELLIEMNKNKPKLFGEIVAAAVSNAALTMRVYEQYPDALMNQRGNMVMNVQEQTHDVEIISVQDRNTGGVDSSQGWKVLREPEVGKIGLKYRVKTGTVQIGLPVNVDVLQTELMMTEIELKKKGVNKEELAKMAQAHVAAESPDSKLITLTAEERATLKYKTSVAHSLLRTYAYNKLLLESQVLRQELIGTRNYKITDMESVSRLHAIAMDTEMENPWTLDTSGQKLPKNAEEAKKMQSMIDEITGQYDKVGLKLSKLDGISKKISYVRNDISQDVIGYVSMDFGPNNYKMNKALDTMKKVVVWTKIQQIIVNPTKIAFDMTSGITLLMTMGMSPIEIAKSFKSDTEELKKLATLRNKKIGLEFALAGEPDVGRQGRLKSKIKKLDAEIKASPVAFALFNGLIQSMSTDITLKNYDSISGLDADMRELIAKLVRDNKGDMNSVGKAIMRFANNDVDLTKMLSVPAEKFGDGAIKDLLNNMADNISKAKTDDDIERYLGEFLGSPSSELVKLGSAMTQYSDVLPRIAGTRYLIRVATEQFIKTKGRKPNETETYQIEQDAVQEMLQAFGDYKKNMPELVNSMSSVFILMYPSFWLRMQKVLWNLGHKHPASLLTAIGVGEALGGSAAHLWGVNIFHKAEMGTLMHTPSPSDLVAPLGNIF